MVLMSRHLNVQGPCLSKLAGVHAPIVVQKFQSTSSEEPSLARPGPFWITYQDPDGLGYLEIYRALSVARSSSVGIIVLAGCLTCDDIFPP